MAFQPVGEDQSWGVVVGAGPGFLQEGQDLPMEIEGVHSGVDELEEKWVAGT
jgi:hypothetical protein